MTVRNALALIGALTVALLSLLAVVGLLFARTVRRTYSARELRDMGSARWDPADYATGIG